MKKPWIVACFTLLLCVSNDLVTSYAAPVDPIATLKGGSGNTLFERHGRNQQILHCAIQGRYAYVLAVNTELTSKCLTLYNLWNTGTKWLLMGSSSTLVVDKSGGNLQYSLGTGFGRSGNQRYNFPLCMDGYTTDPSVTQFRIKTKTGYIPLETLNKQFFMRILSDGEFRSIVEVQGLNEKGEIVQRRTRLTEMSDSSKQR